MNQYIVIFECSVFFNSVQLFDDKYFFTEDNFGPPELRSVGILRLSLTV